MSVIIEFTIDENAFTLGRIFADPPDATVELERNIRANEAVDDLIALDRLSEGTLYRVT